MPAYPSDTESSDDGPPNTTQGMEFYEERDDAAALIAASMQHGGKTTELLTYKSSRRNIHSHLFDSDQSLYKATNNTFNYLQICLLDTEIGHSVLDNRTLRE